MNEHREGKEKKHSMYTINHNGTVLRGEAVKAKPTSVKIFDVLV